MTATIATTRRELTVTATDWVCNARSQELTVSRVNVGRNRITLAGGNRQRGALNTELSSPLIVPRLTTRALPIPSVLTAYMNSGDSDKAQITLALI